MLMPEMDGLELARRIRSQHDHAIPLILLSSLSKHDESVSSGGLFQAVLTKPVKQVQLQKMIISTLQRKNVEKKVATTGPRLSTDLAGRIPLRILVAEDNVVNQKLVVRVFEQMGYRVDLTANGVEVLDALHRQSYDMVFMDIQMPEMDGLEATRRIQSDFPPERQPIIVAVTANALDGDRQVCLNAGMHDYISKPIRFETIQQTIERWADKVPHTHVPTPVEAPQGELLDQETVQMLQSIAENSEASMLVELLEILETQSAELMDAISAALEQGDAVKVKRTAHTLKGSVLNLGAKALAEAFHDMETAAEENDLSSIPEQLIAARKLYEQTLPALKAIYLQTPGQ